MQLRPQRLWWICLAPALLPAASPAHAQPAPGPPRAETRLMVGSDLWFAAVFKLTTAVEGEQLHFVRHHFGVSQSGLDFPIPLRNAVIRYAHPDTIGASRLGAAQWLSHLPLSFADFAFPAGASWDPATNLPGGLIATHSGALLVTVGVLRPRQPGRRP